PDGLLDLASRPPAEPLPPPRLLGSFEPVLLGWRSRAEIVGEDERLVTVNGIFRAFAMVRGRAVATWSLARGRVEVTPFGAAPLSARAAAALRRDARDVERFLVAGAG